MSIELTESERESVRDAIWYAEVEYERQPDPGDRSYRDVAIDTTISWLVRNGFRVEREAADDE